MCVREWEKVFEVLGGSASPGVLDYRVFILENRWRSARNLFEPSGRLSRASRFERDRPTVSSCPINIFPLKCRCPSCYSADRQLHRCNPPCLCSAMLCVNECVSFNSQPQHSCQWPLWLCHRTCTEGEFDKQLRHFCTCSLYCKSASLFTVIAAWLYALNVKKKESSP